MSVAFDAQMQTVLSGATELAYTTLQMRAAPQYVPWQEQPAETQAYWCEAMEAALSYALTQLFTEDSPDAP